MVPYEAERRRGAEASPTVPVGVGQDQRGRERKSLQELVRMMANRQRSAARGGSASLTVCIRLQLLVQAEGALWPLQERRWRPWRRGGGRSRAGQAGVRPHRPRGRGWALRGRQCAAHVSPLQPEEGLPLARPSRVPQRRVRRLGVHRAQRLQRRPVLLQCTGASLPHGWLALGWAAAEV